MRQIAFMFVLQLLCGAGAWAQSLQEAEKLFEKAEFSLNGQKLPYRLLRPVDYQEGKTYPLLVFLHGAGERGSDNSLQLTHAVEPFLNPSNRKKYPCFVLVPQCATDKKWVDLDWTQTQHQQPESSEMMNLLLPLVAQLKTTLPVNNQQIYAMGLSMGGYGVWDLLYRNPDFAAAVVICGGADAQIAEKIGCPVWIFHGAKDKLVPVANGRQMHKALQKYQPKTRYTEYPSVGHGAWIPALKEANLLSWLFAQQKG